MTQSKRQKFAEIKMPRRQKHQDEHEKVRKVEGHTCSLPIEDELVDLYIDGGACVDFRRRFRHRLMISPANPESKSVLKSSAQIRSEENRHLRSHYHMIHPFSEARVVWENIMMVVYFSHFFLMPVEAMIVVPGANISVLYVKLICDIVSLVDVVLFFFTGFYDVSVSKIVMSPKKIAKRYIFRFFIFDLIGSLPYNFVLLHYNLQTTSLFRIKYFCLFRLTRIPTFMTYVRKFCVRMDVWNHKLTILISFLYIIIFIWWATILSFIFFARMHGYDPKYFQENQDLFTPMLDCCYQIVRAFMLISVNTIQENEAILMIFNILCLFFGSIVNIVILKQVMQIYRRRSDAKDKYDSLMQEIGEYMEYKELPPALKNKVFRYVEFKYQKNIFKESDILLSKILREDVILHNCKKMVERVNFFKGSPSALILRIVSKLRSEIYLPNDIIVQAGVTGNAMYFIYMGTVAVYTKTGKEICHLEDGSHFGEISLLINESRVASVVAVTNCEVFRLSRKDFLEAMEPYPKLSDKLKNLALTRLARTKMVMSEDLSENVQEEREQNG